MASVDANISRLDAAAAKIIRQIERATNAVQRESLKEIASVTDKRRTAAATRVVGGLRQRLDSQGAGRAIEETARIFEDIMDDVREVFSDADVAFRLTRAEAQGLEAEIGFFLNRLDQHIDTYVATIQSRMVTAIRAGTDLDDIDDLMQRRQRVLLNSIEVDITNAAQAFRNAMALQKADQAGVEKFLYAGPKDGKNRDFCAERVGRVFSMEQILTMDNGQDLPVLSNLGGHNCRHEWRPVRNKQRRA